MIPITKQVLGLAPRCRTRSYSLLCFSVPMGPGFALAASVSCPGPGSVAFSLAFRCSTCGQEVGEGGL